MTTHALARATFAMRALALPVACSVGGLAVVDPPLALIATIALLFASIAFTNLAAGVAAFAFISFFDHLPGGVSVPSLGRLAGLVLVAAALRRPGAPLLIREHPLVGYVALILVGWAAASTLWAPEPATAALGAVQLGLGIVLVFIVFAAIREPHQAGWVASAYVAGGVASAAIGLATPGPPGESADASRLAGGIGDPNELAAFLVPVVALATFALAAESRLLQRWLLLVALAGSALAVLLTVSRGGYLALAAMLVLGLAAAGPVRPMIFAVLVVLVTAGAAFFAFAASPYARERIADFTSGGGTGRSDIWSVALEAVDDHPVAGVGAGNFPVVEPIYGASATFNLPNVGLVVDRPHVVHNTFLETIVELGAVGGVAFIVLVAALLLPGVRAWRSFRRAGDRRSELLARGLVIGTTGMLVAFLFVSGQTKEQLWLLLGLTFALASLSSRGAAHSARQPRA